MTTNTELIARLRSFETDHKPDGWPAIQMRDVSALLDAIEALEAEVERLTLERDVNKRMRDQHFAEVGRWKALSVTNIMLGIVPGDGSGFEVYAKSVDDVVNKLTELGRKAEDAQGDNVTLRANSQQPAAVPRRTPDMFAELKPPRAAPRVLMKATDHGFCDETPDHPELGHMVCVKCGHDAGWMHFATRTEVKRGEPCPVCNALPNAQLFSAMLSKELLK